MNGPTNRIHRLLLVAFRLSGLLLASMPWWPSFFLQLGSPTLSAWSDEMWVGICHRLPDRTWRLGTERMPLCSRCLGLLEGLGLGVAIARPRFNLTKLRLVVSLASALLFLEITTQDLGWHRVFHPTRLLSAFLVAYPIGAAMSISIALFCLEPLNKTQRG